MKLFYRLLDKHEHQTKLTAVEKELPDISTTEILIQVKCCRTLDLHNDVIKELFLRSPQPTIPAALEVAGIVTKVGSNVSSFNTGDKVAGLLPVTSEWSGCAEYCILGEYDAVCLGDGISYSEAASSLLPGIQAYTTLHHQARLQPGEVVFILDGHTNWGRIAVQLAASWGAKVITTVSTLDEQSSLQRLRHKPDLIIVGNPKTLTNQIIEESGGLGVNVIVDNGVQLFSSGEETCGRPTKHDVITLLAVGGRWVTSCPHLQLDPPNCDQLLLRSASVSFLLPHTWSLCPTRQGKLQHILRNFVQKLDSKDIEIPEVDVLSVSSWQELEESEISVAPGVVLEM